MKLNRKIVWGFDPAKSKVKALQTKTGRLFWGIIRTGHAISQYFNPSVEAFVSKIEANCPKSGLELYSLAVSCGLDIFHFEKNSTDPDLEWWDEMLLVIKGEIEIDEFIPINS